MSLHTLFNPRSVAVIGASSDPLKVGYALMKNVLAGDPSRAVYPVTLNSTEILGKKAYASVKDIGDPVELAVVAVRADIVASVLADCAGVGIKTIVVITAGFKEAGKEGVLMEEELARVARAHDITLLGPNCLGVINAHGDWNASFAVEKPLVGGVSFISQSGAIGTALLDWANREGVGFSKFVSLGNEAALNELEFLEHLANDADTHAVLLYIEHIANGPAFMKLARYVTERKPLVVLQAGTSARGSAAVSSHTGSLAPTAFVCKAALRQVGAIHVETLDELFTFAKLFHNGILTPRKNLVILTNGGGPSVNTTDVLEQAGDLSLVSFSAATSLALQSVLPPMAAVNNPIDVIGDAGPERYRACLEILTTLPDVDAIVTLVTPQMMTRAEEIARVLLTFRDTKPIIPCLMGGRAVEKGVDVLRSARLSNFEFPSGAIRALAKLAHVQGREQVQAQVPAADVPRIENLRMLPIVEMRTMLTEYTMSLEGVFVREGAELQRALAEVGPGPYAIKAISQELVHKSDLKAVQLHLETKADLERAWTQIYSYVQDHTPGATIDGMLVQRMVQGVETIIGMKRDATFGPVIVFGLGGIFVEILKDASIRVAPVDHSEALRQIKEIRSIGLLIGARGREPVDLDALAKVIVALSTLSLEHPEIHEIDLNPVFATPKGTHIVDARIMV